MLGRRFPFVLALCALLIVASCSEDSLPAATAVVTSTAQSDTPQPDPTAMPAEDAVPLLAWNPPPSLDLVQYVNGDQITHPMDGIGPERAFPRELMNGAPELPKAKAVKLWTNLLMKSRVVRTKLNLIVEVVDYSEGQDGVGTGTA